MCTPTLSSASRTKRCLPGPGSTPVMSTMCWQAVLMQIGEQSYNIARNAWLERGLPIETPAATIERQCGSAQQAVNFGATLIASGVADVVIGAGVEHMAHVGFRVAEDAQARYGYPFTKESSWRSTTSWDRA